MMGFIKQQEIKLALRLLMWQYQKRNVPLPSMSELRLQAESIVQEAHRIARERGRNVVAIVKELVNDIRR